MFRRIIVLLCSGSSSRRITPQEKNRGLYMDLAVACSVLSTEGGNQYGVVMGGALCTIWVLKTVVAGCCIKKEMVTVC